MNDGGSLSETSDDNGSLNSLAAEDSNNLLIVTSMGGTKEARWSASVCEVRKAPVTFRSPRFWTVWSFLRRVFLG
jgi:hypothetical protein